MGKLIVELTKELHSRLKKQATLSNRTIKDIVTNLITNYLSKSFKAEKVKETGFCGSWEDERTAEEIVLDIRSHRKWFREGRKKGA